MKSTVKKPSLKAVANEFTTPGTGGRRAFVSRHTKETRIAAAINLDGTGKYDIKTGIGFLDHMLEQLSRHSLIDITLRAEGDLHIDYHHTTEDSGIPAGRADLAYLEPLRREQPPHRRELLQGSGALAARRLRDRSTAGDGGAQHQGCALGTHLP